MSCLLDLNVGDQDILGPSCLDLLDKLPVDTPNWTRFVLFIKIVFRDDMSANFQSISDFLLLKLIPDIFNWLLYLI